MASVDVPPGPPPTGPYGGSSNDFRPLGAGAQGPPSMLNALQGMVSGVQTAAREQEKATRDILAMTERTALILGTTLDRAQTLLITGAAQRERAVGVTLGTEESPLPSGRVTSARPVPQGPEATGVPSDAPVAPERASQRRPTTEVPERPREPSEGRTGATPTTEAPDSPQRPSREVRSDGYPEVFEKASAYFSRGRSEVTTDVPGEGVEGALPEGSGGRREYFPRSFGEGKRAVSDPRGRGFEVGNLRQTAAANMNVRLAAMSQAQDQWYVDEATGMPARRMVPRGSPLIAEDGDPGWRARVVGRAQNFTGQMAEGRSAGQAFSAAAQGSPRLMAVAKGAGVVGAGYVAANAALNFAESQRAGNARFQQSIGGAASDGFGERWNQNMFRLGMRGTMGGRDAETIYQSAAAQYGRDGEMRSRYQEAAVDLYRGAGLDANTSTRMLSMAADESITNLTEFANAIKSVGEAAVEGGMGAQEGRELFERNFRQYDSLGGSTRTVVSEAATEMQLGMGRFHQGVDFSGQTSETFQLQMQMATGMTAAELTALQIGGQPGDSVAYSQIVDTVAIGNLKQYNNGTAWAAMRARLEAAAAQTPNGDLSPQDIDSIGVEALGANELGHPTILADFMSEFGGSRTDPSGAAQLFAQYVAGNVLLSESVESKMIEATTSVSAADGDDPVAALSEAAPFDVEPIAGFGHYNIGESTRWGEADRSMTTRVENAIKNRTLGTGDDDGVFLPMALNLYNRLGEFGDDETSFVVQTSEGPQTVKAPDLIQFYGDQLQADPDSISIISSGQFNGMTVAEVLGVEGGDPNMEITSDKTAEGELMSIEDAEKEKQREHSGDSSRVDISMDPALLQILQVQVNGLDYNQYSASGVNSPASHQVTPEGYTYGGN